MTKRKAAIEAAYRHARQTTGYVPAQITTVVDAVAGHAYELGRIAGLREAANIAEHNRDYPGWIIDSKANKLAKKARAAK